MTSTLLHKITIVFLSCFLAFVIFKTDTLYSYHKLTLGENGMDGRWRVMTGIANNGLFCFDEFECQSDLYVQSILISNSTVKFIYAYESISLALNSTLDATTDSSESIPLKFTIETHLYDDGVFRISHVPDADDDRFCVEAPIETTLETERRRCKSIENNSSVILYGFMERGYSGLRLRVLDSHPSSLRLEFDKHIYEKYYSPIVLDELTIAFLSFIVASVFVLVFICDSSRVVFYTIMLTVTPLLFKNVSNYINPDADVWILEIVSGY